MFFVTQLNIEHGYSYFFSGQLFLEFNADKYELFFYRPDQIAPSVAYLTLDPEVVGPIPGCGETFFPAIFRLSTLIQVRNVASGFGKKSCASTGVRKPGST